MRGPHRLRHRVTVLISIICPSDHVPSSRRLLHDQRRWLNDHLGSDTVVIINFALTMEARHTLCRAGVAVEYVGLESFYSNVPTKVLGDNNGWWAAMVIVNNLLRILIMMTRTMRENQGTSCQKG